IFPDKMDRVCGHRRNADFLCSMEELSVGWTRHYFKKAFQPVTQYFQQFRIGAEKYNIGAFSAEASDKREVILDMTAGNEVREDFVSSGGSGKNHRTRLCCFYLDPDYRFD